MATSRKTGTNEQISTFGTSGAGRDYTDAQAWESANQGDLITAAQSEVLECYDDATSFDTDVKFGGSTTDASYFLLIRPASGQGHDGTPNNGVWFANTNSSPNSALDIRDEYCTVQDIIISRNVSNTAFRYAMQLGNGGRDGAFVGMIVKSVVNSGTGVGRGGYSAVGASRNGYVINCLIQDTDDDGFQPRGSTTVLYNVTCVNNGGDGLSKLSGVGIAKNCIATGNGGSAFTGTWDASSDYNLSNDTTAPGTNSVTSVTPTYVDAATDDFHLSSSDTTAKDAGTDLSADANFAFDDDIDGETITTWSIGFDSIIAGGGGGPSAGLRTLALTGAGI